MKIKLYSLISVIVLTLPIFSVSSTQGNIQNEISENVTTDGDGVVDYWGLFVGPPHDLDHFDKKVRMMKNYLCMYGWEEDHILLLNKEGDTVDDLSEKFDWLSNNTDSDDVIFLYFTAHGSDGWIGCVYPDLSYKTLNMEVDKLKSNKIFILIQSCDSGSAIPELTKEGRIIVTSSKADESSGDIDYLFIHALQGYGDYLGDFGGKVSVEESFNFISRHQLGYHPQIDDNISGELEIISIDESDRNPDQFQTLFSTSSIGLSLSACIVVQSFKPSFDKINRLKLFIGVNGNPSEPLTISIRKDLTDEDLTNFTLTDINSTFDNNFCFPEISVTPGETYYIVCGNESPNNYTDCYCIVPVDSVGGINPYENGKMIYSYDGEEWLDNNNDIAFVTFYDNGLPPEKPNQISGDTSGLVRKNYQYCSNTTDPEGDPVYYWFDWGDDTSSGWIGPYQSGEKVYINHSWDTEGTYRIRVISKDTHGYKSNWSEYLSVTLNNNAPTVQITKPEKALYINNKTIRKFLLNRAPLIIGKINIEVSIDEESEIDRVEFYIDNELRETDTATPYNYTWEKEKEIKFNHTIKVVAFDIDGKSSTDEITVWKFL